MANKSINTSKNKAIGYSLIGLAFVLFIFSIIPNFVITNFFLGTFGLAWYAYLIILSLFGLANVLGLKYNYNKKFTVYLSLAVIFFIMLLHIMVSTSSLAMCEGFSDYGLYLNNCFNMTNGVSIGGAFVGIFVYLVKTLLGLIGVYSVTIIALSIFVGIVLDSIVYKNNKKNKNISVKDNRSFNANNYANVVDNTENIIQSYKFAVQDDQNQVESINLKDINANKELSNQDQSSSNVTSNTSTISEQEKAKNRLFKPNFDSYIADEAKADKSARDILFGSRELPDITLPNDKERDQWVKNYREEHNTIENPISDLYGGGEVGQNDLSEAYKRNFPTRPVFEDSMRGFNQNYNNTNSDITDDISNNAPVDINPREITNRLARNENIDSINTASSDTNYQAERISEVADSRLNRFNGRTEREPLVSERTGFNGLNNRLSAQNHSLSASKLGENLEDQAKATKLDFGNTKVNKPSAPVGKQMGFKSVRYNSIPLSMFRIYEEKNADYSEEYKRKTEALEKVMEDFRIGAKVINIVRGPKVTRYELTLPDGVSVSRVLNIETDISMAIEARSKIRIEAPIPGKKAFGIELENDVPSTVGMRELLESPEFTNCKDPLPIAIGKDINGKVIIKSLPKMIHLLVAGSSGSGKSIFIHSLMMSILYKYSPDDVRFIMIDPKRVEFSMYNNLPHLMLPNVVSEHDKALNSIKWCVQEMDDRYKKLQESECQNIEQYNKQSDVVNGTVTKMPYLIIVVDELAELMGGALKKDFEAGIQRITQLGRAAGIHMVVATQRPSVDVVTGTIKNNMPTRVAFALASFADSKTVLDEGGAENLLGKGDMLFAPQDMNIKIRLQAAFCDNDEIRNAIKYVKENNESTYDEDVMKQVYAAKQEESEASDAGSFDNGDDMDDYMKLAVKFAKATGKVSVSMLQRKFRIGFNRAARIVDQMSDFGWVGPSIGSKPRDFIITDEQYEEMFGPDDDSEF